MSESAPKQSHNESNPLMQQVEQMQEEERQKQRLRNFVDHRNDASVDDFARTQEALGRMEGGDETSAESSEVNPLDEGLFQDDVFYNEDTERVISVGPSRSVGGETLYRVTIENPTANGADRKSVREMTESDAKAFIGGDGAQLIEGGYERNPEASASKRLEGHTRYDAAHVAQGSVGTAEASPSATYEGEGVPKHEYTRGQTILLPDGTSMTVLGRDRESGKFLMHEIAPGDDQESMVHLMGQEELDSLAQDLQRTPEQSSELYRRVLAGEDDPEASLGSQAQGETPPSAGSMPREQREAQLDALRQQYGALADKQTPEARDIRRRINDLYSELQGRAGDTDSGVGLSEQQGAAGEGAPLSEDERRVLEDLAAQADSDTPIIDAARAAQAEEAAQERQAQREATLKRIDDEVNGSELGDVLRSAMSRYAELKADSETKGRWGRTKREKLLKEAESALLEAKMKLERAKIDKRRAAGTYEGDETQINEQSADDMFNGVRGLDEETRRATNEELDTRERDRGPFKRAVAAVGRFFTSGGKVAQWAKGAGVGAAAGFGVTMTGLGVPVTTVTGIGLGLGARSAAVTANLDRIRAENKDAQGNATRVLNDEQFAQLMNAMRQSGTTVTQKSERLGQEIFDLSRERGYEQADRARRDANRTMGRFALGFAAGGVAGTMVHEALSRAGAAAGGNNPPGGNGGTGSTPPGAGSGNNLPPSGGYNFPPNADVITRGEGWLHQFGDMGMTSDQARAMLNDSTVMQKLVDLHVAYPSTSPTIGAYGISSPGTLSPEVMKVIGDAMTAKGF